uniref:RING-type domain-containing protein n=2 Tax=Auxenochlorella protothecoides TaxID=3075 RepID=A0A1D1ZPS4_AUXPR
MSASASQDLPGERDRHSESQLGRGRAKYEKQLNQNAAEFSPAGSAPVEINRGARVPDKAQGKQSDAWKRSSGLSPGSPHLTTGKAVASLLKFQYAPRPQISQISRPRQLPAPNRSTRRAAYAAHVNHRFLISDVVLPHLSNWDLDLDTLWADVVQVEVLTSEDLVCPITLEMPVCPQITPCGHVFSCHAIVQHMGGINEGPATFRCPLCFSLIKKLDLRSASIRRVAAFQVGKDMHMVRRSPSPAKGDVSRNFFSEAANGSQELHVSVESTAKMQPPVATRNWASMPRTGSASFEARLPSCHAFERFTTVSDPLPLFQQQAAALCRMACQAEAEGGLEAAFTAPFIRQSATFVSQQAAQWYEHQSIRKHTFDGAISQADAAAAKKLGAQAARQVDQAGASVTGATVVATRLQQQFPSLPSEASQQETLYGRSDASRQDPGTEASGSAAAESSPRPDGNEQTDTAGVESLVAGSTALHASFQSDDGQWVFLSPVNMRMLLHEAEATATPLPTGLHGRLLELEYITQTEASRRRYRALSHLPLGATFRLCELDLSDCCSADTLDAFSEGLKLRAARRARLAKQAAHQSRRDTMAATEAAARAAYPVPQAAPPIEEWGGEPKLWIDPGAIVTSATVAQGGVSYARLTREGFTASGPELSSARSPGASVPSVPSPQGAWAKRQATPGAQQEGTRVTWSASTPPHSKQASGGKGKKTVVYTTQQRKY